MAFSKQIGPCAFSASCLFPGERVPVAGTNQEFCPVHAHLMQISMVSDASATEFSSTAFHAPSKRRRASAWMAGVAVGV